MILTECAVFFGMLFAGMGTAAIATLFLTLGGGSKAARAVFDILTPLFAGATFFVCLYFLSGGAMRLYAVLAFVSGGALFYFVWRKISPFARRLIKRALVPIFSLEKAVEKLFFPLTERLKNRRKIRLEKRAQNRRLRAEKKANRLLQKRLAAQRKRDRTKKKTKVGASLAKGRLRQSH